MFVEVQGMDCQDGNIRLQLYNSGQEKWLKNVKKLSNLKNRHPKHYV